MFLFGLSIPQLKSSLSNPFCFTIPHDRRHKAGFRTSDKGVHSSEGYRQVSHQLFFGRIAVFIANNDNEESELTTLKDDDGWGFPSDGGVFFKLQRAKSSQHFFCAQISLFENYEWVGGLSVDWNVALELLVHFNK